MLSAIRLCLLVITALALALQYFLPERTFDLLAHNVELSVFADQLPPDQRTKVLWREDSSRGFECLVRPGSPERYCGMSIKFLNARDNYMPVDLSNYDEFIIDIAFQGPSNWFNFSYRNMDEVKKEITDLDDIIKLQSIFTYIDKTELSTSVRISVQAFDLADWWLNNNFKSRRQFIHNQNAIVELNIQPPNNPPPGNYIFELKSLKATGEWVSQKSLYFYIVMLWISAALIEAIYRGVILQRQKREYENSLSTLHEEFKALESAALTDELTGIYNRSGFMRIAKKRSFTFSKGQYYIFLFDIDYFKVFNDNHGHDIGDRILAQMSQRISNCIRIEDVFARWGGEEFLLLSHHNNQETAFLFANKLRKIVSDTQFDLGNDAKFYVTLSVGVSAISQLEKFDVAFKRADECLYKAKKRGRNRVVMHKK